MKQLRILIIVLIIFTGCQNPIQDNEILTDSFTQEFENPSKVSSTGSNQIIINYDESLTETERQALRNQYGVTDYKTCKCADPNLELWVFQGGVDTGAIIEEVTASANGDSGIEDAGFNPKVDLIGTTNQVAFGPADVNFARQQVVPVNQNVTIAVLDTGIDYNYPGFDSPVIYNNSLNPDACIENGMQDYYGWDFVNQDNDPYDEGYGHGTRVSYLIKETMEAHNVDFQILPVKVFDQNGEGSYFDILCGFRYATKNPDVNIINMSFGWYDDRFTLLEKFISEAQDQVMITASAGNYAVDTDQFAHYPSGYDSENIIATAAMQGFTTNIALTSFSNFGIKTIDVAAQGENIPFTIGPGEVIYLSGTSYANAKLTAHAATEYTQGISIPEWIAETLENTVYHQNLDMLKYSSYIDD